MFSVCAGPLQSSAWAAFIERSLESGENARVTRRLSAGLASIISTGASTGQRPESVAPRTLPLMLTPYAEVLPRGLPRASVIEVSAAGGLAGSTSLALAACAAAQAEARQRGEGDTLSAFAAWVDSGATLHAPAALRAGLDLERLLVVRPPESALARAAVRLAESRALSLLVVDLAGVPGASVAPISHQWQRVVRRLSIALEGTQTSVLLLTDSRHPRPAPLPVSMRVDLERPSITELRLGVSKDRRGCVSPPRPVGQNLRDCEKITRHND